MVRAFLTLLSTSSLKKSAAVEGEAKARTLPEVGEPKRRGRGP